MYQQIILRQFNIEKDLPFFHRAHSDASSMKYYGMHGLKSIEDSYKLMIDYIESEKNNKSIHRVICDMQCNEYMGEIGLFNIHPIHHRAEVYYIIFYCQNIERKVFVSKHLFCSLGRLLNKCTLIEFKHWQIAGM